jgi:hypothetical protein
VNPALGQLQRIDARQYRIVATGSFEPQPLVSLPASSALTGIGAEVAVATADGILTVDSSTGEIGSRELAGRDVRTVVGLGEGRILAVDATGRAAVLGD